MRRREFLGSVAIAAISGCVGTGESSEKTENPGATPRSGGETKTKPPEKTETQRTQTTIEATRSVTDPPLEVELGSWWGERTLRYHDSDAGELRELEPTRSWWLQPRVRVSNIGSQAAELPDIPDFSALTPAEWEPVENFEIIDRSDLRQPNDANIISVTFPGDHVSDGQLKPGDSIVYVPLFDVGELEELSLAWETSDGAKYLATDVVHLSD